MGNPELLFRLLNTHKVRGVTCADVLGVMLDVGCMIDTDQHRGPCIGLFHPMHMVPVDLRDNGPRPMWGGYVDDAAEYLRVLRDKGLIDETQLDREIKERREAEVSSTDGEDAG